MSPTQTAELLRLCSAYDQRTVGDADVLAWIPLMAPVDFVDAEVAVQAWYAEHRERITPADIRKAVRAARRDRLDRAPHTDPPAEVQSGDTRAYLEWLRGDRKAKASADAPTLPAAPPHLPRRELERRFGAVLPDVPGRRPA